MTKKRVKEILKTRMRGSERIVDIDIVGGYVSVVTISKNHVFYNNDYEITKDNDLRYIDTKLVYVN